MKIIVDANVVFSAILNTNGKIGYLLINAPGQFHFIAPDFLRTEIRKHYPRLVKLTGLKKTQIEESEYRICKHIEFISEEQVPAKDWIASEQLVLDIDPKDVAYVAFSRHFKCKIWSGDKALRKGLEKKGFKNIITTEELYAIVQTL